MLYRSVGTTLKLPKLDFFFPFVPSPSTLITDGNDTCSGDQDTKIPLTQTRIIANMLAQQQNLTTFTPYTPWYDKQQVLGPLHFQFNSLLLINLLVISFKALNGSDLGHSITLSWGPISTTCPFGFNTDNRIPICRDHPVSFTGSQDGP